MRILIIEDVVETANSLVDLLQEELQDHFEESALFIDFAYTANEALQKVTENDYDIVISDLVMKGMQGYELIPKLKEMKGNLKIAVLSAYGPTFDLETHVDTFWKKPPNFDSMISYIVKSGVQNG